MSLTFDVAGAYPGPFQHGTAATGFETDMAEARDDGGDDQPATSGASTTPSRPARPRPRIRTDLLPVWPVELVWRCEGCGYLRQGTHRPDFCPACGAGPERLVGRSNVEWRRIFRQEMLEADRREER